VSPKNKWFVALLPLLLGFDFWSKSATRELGLGEQVPILDGWLALTHAENPSIAFSLPVPFWVIVGFGVVALAVMAQQLWALRPQARMQAAGLAAMAAGALGNLIDRIADGTVTDMVMLYTDHPALSGWLKATFGTATWPIFNVADVALLGGVTLFLAGTASEPEEPPSIEAEAEAT
jgi:signal peptidase II